jgi:hypothetical protein
MSEFVINIIIAILGGAASFVAVSWKFGGEESKKSEKIAQLEASSTAKNVKIEDLSTKVTILERDLHNLKNNMQADFARANLEWTKLEHSVNSVKEMCQDLVVSMAELKAAIRGEESKSNRRPG